MERSKTEHCGRCWYLGARGSPARARGLDLTTEPLAAPANDAARHPEPHSVVWVRAARQVVVHTVSGRPS
jgi:hypothetical protein